MVRLPERAVSIGAAVSALSVLLCCLPLPFVGAIGVATVGAAISPIRFWLIGLSLVFLGAGFVQVYRQPRACRRSSTASLLILWASAIVVVMVLLMPQLLSSLIADWLG